MRARMSDPATRRQGRAIAAADVCQGTRLIEALGMAALDEARSILADAEPVDYAWYRMRAHHATGWGSLEALAESLRSFVEGN